MRKSAWEQMLAEAYSQNEVMAVARDFIASIDPADLARLPQVCRPRNLADTDDVMAYAYELVRHHCANHSEPDAAETIDTLECFFSQAAVRLSQLTALSVPSKEIARLFS
jgi:hypothetical protein